MFLHPIIYLSIGTLKFASDGMHRFLIPQIPQLQQFLIHQYYSLTHTIYSKVKPVDIYTLLNTTAR